MKHCILFIPLILLNFNACSIKENNNNDNFSIEYQLSIKEAGNPSAHYILKKKKLKGKTLLCTDEKLPLEICETFENTDSNTTILKIELIAKEKVHYNIKANLLLHHTGFESSLFYLPGFWYRKNSRSPENTPSMKISKTWEMREDRLSTPLVGVFDKVSKEFCTVLRKDKLNYDALTPLKQGETILSGKSDIGSLGFANFQNKSVLSFRYPYSEYPYTYLRKLTLAPPVTSFATMNKGEKRTLVWEIKRGRISSYEEFIKENWYYSFNTLKPQPLKNRLSNNEVKEIISNYFKESFTTSNTLQGFSGVHLHTNKCEKRGILEVGFIGRVLLNAFNCLEFAEQVEDEELKNIANAVFESYRQYGFNKKGFFKEVVDINTNTQNEVNSIRRQSEGVYAILLYLFYERGKGKKHNEWEDRVKSLLDKLILLQQIDGSFPRKFDNDILIIDKSGGSSPSAVLPFILAYKYFNENKYLEVAKKIANYVKDEIILKSDYFSSTLDANCEDKEASLYAATAFYYLSLVSANDAKKEYLKLCEQASYFALSWYYLYDVPFSKGQMLGELNFKSRGWGNVSVENNHIDVFIFEFIHVLEWLSKETKNQTLREMAEVIKTSMKEQLLPYENHWVGIAKKGYYPEVVQHTNWDYGKNGKGFYNDIFAPGWTVASLWEVLTDDSRTEIF